MLTFKTVDNYALYEVLLQHKENGQGRQQHQRRCRHQVVVFHTVHALELSQTQSEREFIWAVEIDEGPQKIVPVCHKRKDRHRDQRRLAQGQQDAGEDLKRMASVDACCIVKLTRDDGEELSQEKNVEGVSKKRGYGQWKE